MTIGVFFPSGWDLIDCVGGLSGTDVFFFHQGGILWTVYCVGGLSG